MKARRRRKGNDMRIAWIGTGVMGSAMAAHLLAGNEMTVYNRSAEKTAALAAAGAHVASSVGQAVIDAEAVFTMVAYPDDVRQVYLQDGILDNAPAGCLAVDMTTSSPGLAVQLHEYGRRRDIAVLDAPVSGGDVGARQARLTIMVGGDPDAYQKVLPLLARMGASVTLMGPAGMGQQTKAANQIAVAGATSAMAEAIAYARCVGLDPALMVEVISKGAAGSWQLSNMAPRVLDGDMAPGFYVKHFVKDLHIIQQEAAARGLDLKMVDAVTAMYERLMAAGGQDLGTQALAGRYDGARPEPEKP